MSTFNEAFDWMNKFKGNKIKDPDGKIVKIIDKYLYYEDDTKGTSEYKLSVGNFQSDCWIIILPEYTTKQKDFINQFCSDLLSTFIDQGWNKGDMIDVKTSIKLTKVKYGIVDVIK